MPKRTPHPRASERPPHSRAPERPAPSRSPAPPPPASRRSALILAAMIAAYAAVFGFIAVVKFRYYLYADFDLAIFVQATDQALRGSLFSSIRGMSWLGDHVSLILFVVAPLYALIRHPLTLLLLQCFTLALGAWPVFALARRELRHEGVALMFAGLYLLYPAVGYTNLFEFHPEVFATATLLATIAALAANRMAPAVVFAVLSVLCREDVALVVAMLGLTSLLPGRPRRIGALLLGVALVSLVVSFGVILPRLSSTAAEYGRMYGEWGKNLPEIATNLLSHPMRAVSALLATPGNPADTTLKQLYWVEMLGPLLFLPLLSPLTLVCALPIVAEHFLSFRDQQHRVVFQYTALVTPVMVAAAVRGLAMLVRLVTRVAFTPAAMQRPGRVRSLAFGAAGAALGASLLCNLLYGPLLIQGWIPFDRTTETHWPSDVDRTLRPYRDRMVARVPREGGAVTGFEFLSRLASRHDVHAIHHLYTGFYTFSTRPYPVPDGVAALLADIGDPLLAKYVKHETPDRLRELMARNRLHPADAAGDLLLLTRDAADTVELVRVQAPPAPVARQVTFDDQLACEGFALPESVTTPGGLLPIETYWRRVAQVQHLFAAQFVLTSADGTPAFSLVRHLGYLIYPPSSWPADTRVRETYRLLIPADIVPGTYTLGLRLLWWEDGRLGVAAAAGPDVADPQAPIRLGTFTVTKR